jgi:hypothetical protein
MPTEDVTNVSDRKNDSPTPAQARTNNPLHLLPLDAVFLKRTDGEQG